MVETEVENILREIREQVLTQERAIQGAAAVAGISADVAGSAELRVADSAPDAPAGSNLPLINSYLTTTGRAWDRLPPVVSNRSGVAARLELWCKRQMKRATRWYSWEQVNFNAAVHHAVRDLLTLMTAYEQELEKLRVEVMNAHAPHRVEGEQTQVELAALRAELASLRVEVAARTAETRAAVQALSDLTNTGQSQAGLQLAGLAAELRERDEHLRAEQRVSFKQLSLETTEAATLEDRARHRTESRLAELQRRLEELEQARSDG
jgi:hypothetical protein